MNYTESQELRNMNLTKNEVSSVGREALEGSRIVLLLLLIQWQVTNEDIVSNLIANSTRSPWKPEE